MIEGLRVLPHVEDARKAERDAVRCDVCIANNDENLRSALGCGWLASPCATQVPFSDRVEGIETCPGYTTELPEVADAMIAWVHWEKGALGFAISGDAPSPALMDAVSVFNTAVAAFREWYRESELRKGGNR